MNKGNKDNFLDNVTYKRKHPINGIYSKLIDNKAFLHTVFPHTAEIQVIFQKGKEISRVGLDLGDLFESLEKWILKNNQSLIIKPLQGSGGTGVEELKSDNYKEQIKERIINRDSFIINEKISQLRYSNEIFPDSLNTIRFVFFRDLESQEIHIAGCSHRFGTSFSAPADNAKRGGIFTEIDHETGVLGRSFVYLHKKYGGWHDIHPETKAPIKGVQIPNWSQGIQKVIGTLSHLTWLKYGGLDLVFTEGGFKVIEINSLPDLELVQMKNPLFQNQDFSNFFKSL
ncbi:sugar-transfer associated ATP-grasp domain-containing protein [Arthrospiribacter ruber]|uniref:sugar-transfer associated ATP-grasp domain-containing protein n=1 Tax=Arthrospiribacter ruber TaxID=2487934 RepID=UPI001C5B025D|nr:sugar-transfer associated ATP-grasp domain-containing protein [Arthrospiribacter ruber]